MKATTFHSLILGLLCVSAAGLAAVALNQHRQLEGVKAAALNPDHESTIDQRWAQLDEGQSKLSREFEQLLTQQQHQATAQAEQQRWREEATATLQSLTDASEAYPAPVDLTPLQGRLQVLEQKLQTLETRPPQAATPRPELRRHTQRVAARPLPVKPVPPFSALGIETRGAETFLSVLPNDMPALRYVRLLQPGEAFGGWQLQSASQGTATFMVGGHPVQSLPVPERTTP